MGASIWYDSSARRSIAVRRIGKRDDPETPNDNEFR